MTKRALITGGTGFIGSHTVEELLNRDWEVSIVDISDFPGYVDLKSIKDHENLKFYKLDLNSFDEINSIENNFDYIFHFAAQLGVEDVSNAPYQVLTSNISTTQNIINYAKSNPKLTRFIFTSTSEVYSGTQKHFTLSVPTSELEPLTIDSVASPRSSYMLSKTIGESLCHFSQLPFTILRPFNIYGARGGMRHVIPQLLEKVYQANSGESIDVFSTDHTRAFCHIDDAINQIMYIVDNNECCNETINLGNETREITMNDLAEICINVSGKDLKINKLEATEGSPKRRTPSMKKSIGLIGYNPKVKLEDGIVQTYSWYIDNVYGI